MATLPKLTHCLASIALASVLASVASSQVNVTTYHNNNQRTGVNPQETLLNTSNVNSTTFGLIFSLPVDGYVYAEPLYLGAQTIPGLGVHNVLYVATQHNSVYAFDADSNLGANSQPLWHVNLGPSVPNGDVGSSDITPEIGITATPVIAPATVKGATGTIYVVAKTKTLDINNNPVYTNTLHALDVTTGAEKFGGPMPIQATVAGTGDGNDGNGHVPFNGLIQQARPALLLAQAPGPSPSQPTAKVHNAIYIGFASHGDNGPYHGWVFAYDPLTLQQLAVLNTTPNATTDPSGYPLAAGGIWQSGDGIAADVSGIYFSTGNGTLNPANGSYGDCIVKCDLNSLKVLDYFSPSDQLSLDYGDGDQGSGGVLLLPKEQIPKRFPGLIVQAGKEGSVFLTNAQSLGKYHSKANSVVQELPYAIGGVWGSPCYFNNNLYFGGQYSPIVSIPINLGVMGSPQYSTSVGYGYPGPSPAISSNGNSSGIVWAIQTDNWTSGGPAFLQAYDASNVSTLLYNSASTNGRDVMGAATKFAVPTVANGKVYAGTGSEVDVFGLGQWTAAPTLSQPGGTYNAPIMVNITDTTPGATIRYTTDGSTPTVNSTVFAGPLLVSNSETLTAKAFAPGYGSSAAIQANYLISPVIGTGTGLLGSYYNGTTSATGTVTATRLDPSINFNWNGGSPISGVAGTDWSCVWTGTIQPETTATYQFTTDSDDGVQLFVNGQQLVNDWTDHAPTYDSGTITLQAGQKYSIKIEYYQNGGGSLLQLFWSAPGLPMQIVPTSQLYPQ